MPDKKLTEELLNELLDAPSIEGYIKEHDFTAPSLSEYLKQLFGRKGAEAFARGAYGRPQRDVWLSDLYRCAASEPQ